MARRPDRPPIGSSVHRPAAGGTASGTRASIGTEGGSAGTRNLNFTRPALAPGLIAAVVLVVGTWLLGNGAFVAFRWGATVLALIVLVFAYRGRVWWAAVLMVAIAVLWNPVLEVSIPAFVWAVAQPVAAGVFIAAGIFVKVPRSDE